MLYHLTTTLPDRETAEALARALVENQRVACAHIHPAHDAFYLWEGALCATREFSLHCIVTEDALEAAAACIRAQHPHTVPCVMSWPVRAHGEAYEAWARSINTPIPTF